MIPDHYESSPVGRRRLPNRNVQRGARMGLPTWGGFALGGVFTATGVAIALVGAKVIPVDPRTVHAPYWVLTAVGACFGGAGLWLLSRAWRQYAAGRRRLALTRQHPGAVAMADYPWHTDGFAVTPWAKAGKQFTAAVGLTVFLSMFNWWAFVAHGPWMVKGIVGLFDLIALAVWAGALTQVGRAFKFGGSRVEFPRFPFRLAEPIVLRWPPPKGVERANKGTFILRCVEERFEMQRTGNNQGESTNQLVHDELWNGTWSLQQPRNLLGGDKAELKFEPPAGLPPTNLSGDVTVFWELEVKLDLPGLDFAETYLVPVYGDASGAELPQSG